MPRSWGAAGDAGGSPQLEEQLSRLQREKNEVQSRLEEDQEDMNELMKKHKAAVAQVRGEQQPRHPHPPIMPLSSWRGGVPADGPGVSHRRPGTWHR